jgi:hypothetical protein
MRLGLLPSNRDGIRVAGSITDSYSWGLSQGGDEFTLIFIESLQLSNDS